MDNDGEGFDDDGVGCDDDGVGLNEDGVGFDEDGEGFDEAGEPTAQVSCPYCGAWVEVILDPGGASAQSYVEDCEVCCRPWHLSVHWDASGTASVEARSEDG